MTFEQWGKKYGAFLSILVFFLVWVLPTPAGMSLVQHKLLAIFSGAIVVWITIGVNFAVSTLAIIVLLYFWVGSPTGAVGKDGFLVRNAAFALSGFGSASLWLLITGFIISIAMTRTGVAKRIALLIMKSLGRTSAGAIGASMLANFVIAPLTPSNTARTAAMLPIVEGIADAYNAKPGSANSNFGKALALSAAFTSNITGSAFLTGTIPNPVSIGLIAAAAGTTVFTTWSYWALASVPTNLIILAATLWLCLKLHPPEVKSVPGGLAYVDEQLAQMGPITLPEKKAVFYFLLALALWSTDSIHKLISTLVAFLVSLFICQPKIGVLDWRETEKSLPWELFMYFGGVLTLSEVLMKTKSFEWIIKTGMGLIGLESMSMLPLLIILMGFSIFSHVIWSTTTAMTGVMMPIYIGLAQALGFPIIAFCLPMALMMAYALFLPFNTMGNIIIFGTGYYSVTEQLKASLLLGLIIWGLWIVTVFTWWQWIGLL